MTETIVLIIVGFLTSVISTVTGMGGGIVLLSSMTFFFSIQTIVPIHGMVQLVANSARVYYLRRYLIKSFLVPYIVGVPIGALISVLALKKFVGPDVPKALITLTILYALFRPKRLPGLAISGPWFFPVGIATGALGILIGSVGPFLAPFYIREDISKEKIIANKSAMQMLVHFSKLPAFFYLGFDYLKYSGLILAMGMAVIAGTYGGVWILNRINDRVFKSLFWWALFLSAVRLVWSFFEK